MGDSCYLYPVALRWDEGPEALKQVKNKLLLHFQKKKLSNGGECEIRDLDCSRGHLLIYFRDKGVRDRVLQKKPQELKLQDGRALLLDLCSPEELDAQSAPPSGAPAAVCKVEEQQQDEPVTVSPGHEEGTRPRSSYVLIENVQDSCSPEKLNLLVGSISDVPDFYVEMIPERCLAVVTFTCDIDVEAFNEKFSNHHITKQYNMRATALEDTKVVRAEDLSPNTSEETITLHFESARYGGGPVEKVEMMPDLNAALITFYRQEVVKSVLTRTHQINEKAIPVFPYYLLIGECLYGKEKTVLKSPDPVDFQISPFLLEFFLNNAQIKQDMEDHMADHHCEIRWPAPHCQKPVVTLSVSSKLSAQSRKMSKIAPSWSKNVHSQFSLLTSKYEVRQYDVKSSVWETIKEKVSSPTYNGILFKADLVAEKVFLVGLSEDLIKSESSFKDLVSTATIELTQEDLAVFVKPHIYKFLSTSLLVRCFQEESPNLKIEYDSTTSKVKLCGIKVKVQNAKCEILEATQVVRSRAVHQDPQIIQFLSVVDNEDLSCFLFTTNNINAMIQVRTYDVLLVAASEKDLVEAERQMKKELVCKRITIEDRRVIQMPEWDSVRINMADLLNTEKTMVLMDAIPAGAEKEVVIYGLSSAVDIAYQQIHEFLMENTVVQEEIVVKSRAIVEFIEKEILDVAKYNINITRKDNGIRLSGPKQYVKERAEHLRSAVSKLHSETLYIDKPGAKKFCLENEDGNAKYALSMYRCAIHLEKDGQGEAVALEMNLNEPLCRLTLENGVTIAVHADNPYQQKVGVVVIVTSEDLKPMGGLEQTLHNDLVRAECEAVIQKEGKLAAGESIITNAGNLPCKQLIHVVSPKSGSKSKGPLCKAVKSVLDLAAKNGHTSIALSASSFAACGYPVETCTECIVTAIQQHMEGQEGSSSIRYIHLVDSEDRIVKAFIQSLSDEYEEKNIQFTSKQEVKKQKAQKSKNDGGAADKYNRQMVTTKEGLKIKIIQGNIQDATSNVIVNSVGKELDLRSGAVSSAIFRKAGARLQDLLNREKPQSAVTDGCVFITDGCGLPCHLVLHAVVPRWDEGQGSSEQILRKIVNDCLSASEEKRMHSISFPAMGTGILGFPKNTVAAIMYDESLNFSSKGNVQHLKEVTFMLHPSDTETAKAFSTELEKKTKDPTSQKKSEKSHGLFGPVTSPSAGVTEMKIGPVTYQVKTGDLTKEDADIIVNSTNNTFNLKSGVSKKILEEAGKDVEDECARLGAAPSKPSLVVTEGGKLPCRNIIHVAAITNPANLKKKVTEALAESERLQATSVAFPALGTGVGGLSATVVADVMVDAVVDFVSSKSAKSVQTVKVVIFQPPMLDDFRTSLKKKEHKPSFFSWFIHRMFGSASDQMAEEEDKVFELRENIEPAIFHLCAGTKKDVTDASTWLRDLILKKQNENEIIDDWILELGDEEKQEISALQKTLQVTVHIDLPSTTIKVSGLSRDVLEMTNKIQLMLKKVREKKTKEREAELCSNLVEWRYHNGTNFVLFDRMTNLELEKAKSTNTQSLKIDVSGVTYTVLLELNCMRDPRGKQTEIERFPKHGNILELPTSWDSMEKTQLKVVPVAATSQEYSDVHAQFAKTCQMKVVKIERIQNLHLYQNYQIKKQSIDTKNGSAQNERQLFHGTDEKTVKSVNGNGFNRSYSGLNVGAVLGNGTYFAVEANYSAHDNYSKPNANGLKYMYLTRVLTGASCAGQKGCIAPPAKNPANPTDLYDSVTDNPANPQIFVIFNDVQAYPEYLITFSK